MSGLRAIVSLGSFYLHFCPAALPLQYYFSLWAVHTIAFFPPFSQSVCMCVCVCAGWAEGRVTGWGVQLRVSWLVIKSTLPPKVTPGTPCLAVTETPERRCELGGWECEREEKKKTKQKKRALKCPSAQENHGDQEEELAEERPADKQRKKWDNEQQPSKREADI